MWVLGVQTPALYAAPPAIGGRTLLPADDSWNMRVDRVALDSRAGAGLGTIDTSCGDFIQSDFGEHLSYGIPRNTASGGQAPLPVSFEDPEKRDAGPYPVPPGAPVEAGDDDRWPPVSGASRLQLRLPLKCSGAAGRMGVHQVALLSQAP